MARAAVLAVVLLGGGATARLPWVCPRAVAEEDTAARIQAKIAQVGAAASRLHDAGGDVAPIQQAMQQVDTLLRRGDAADAERMLDALLAKLGVPATAPTAAAPVPAQARDCDAHQPMTVTGTMTITDDCTIGGDLTVTGGGVLHFDYSASRPGRLVVRGNVIVRDHATLWIEGRADQRAVIVIDNDVSQQRTMTSAGDATIRLDHVEFRTRVGRDRDRGSVYMSYDARDRSKFEATDATLVEEECWLLANLHDAAQLTISDTRSVPTEIYVRDASSATIRGPGTQTGLWLDAGGAKGTVRLPDVNGPFSWRIGAASGLGVGWSLLVDHAQPGLGIEVKPDSALTILGHGASAPLGGELKISYFAGAAPETLDGLRPGIQNGRIGERLTLRDVQLGPIAWQLYAGDDADLTVRHSTINEIGIFGRDATVHVAHSVLQLAVLAAMAPGSRLDIDDSDIWNQAIEAANGGAVAIGGSTIHGSLFHARDPASTISITGGSFRDNPAGCTQATMIDLATGHPNCNPFGRPGPPRVEGSGKVACRGTDGCTWTR